MNRFSYILACIFCALFFSASLTKATNYYSLHGGDFSDNSSVWSTDGTNACGCFPPANFSIAGDSIFVRHEINLNLELLVQNGAHLEVTSDGLLGGNLGIRMENGGSIANLGNLNPEFLIIRNSSLVSTGGISTNGSFLNINSTSDISGSLHVGLDYRNMQFGTLILRTNTAMVVDGFFFNIGTMITEPGVCVQIGGDFFNPELGIVLGGGHIAADFNVTNNGAWDVNTTWCAGVSSFGMPTPPNCITCGPLPVALSSFDVVFQLQEETVRLIWNTESEVNNDHFLVERSTNGKDFVVLGEIASQFSPDKGGHYEWTDGAPVAGMNYYRLRQIDRDGRTQSLATEKAYVAATARTHFVAFPSPTVGPLHFQLALEEAASLQLTLLDLAGKEVLRIERPAAATHHGTIELGHLPAGTYLLRAKAGTYVHSERVHRI